jgi:hypothetical protein
MKFQSTIKPAILLACAMLLAACNTPGAAPVAATQDVATTLSAARTEAAVIVATQIANQASPTPLPATSTLAPSATTLPSDTPVPALPTNTPLPQVTATKTLIPFTKVPAFSATPKNYNCSITKTVPDGDTLTPRLDFDGRWTVKNTGSETWTVADYDYKYVSGEKMHIYDATYNFKSAVATGESIDIIVDMRAPDKAGPYAATWAIVKGNTTVCTMTVSITVK